jgi:DNA-binding beta-propeller fold protein YncE
MTTRRLLVFALPIFCIIGIAAAAQEPVFRVLETHVVGGNGGWDYVVLDTVGHRLFVGHEDRISVIDENTGKLLGEVTGLHRAHGTALAYPAGRGFATSGEDSTVTMFDLKTLKVLGRMKAADDDDGVFFDPASKRVYTMNGDAHSSTVIDPFAGKVAGNIPLGGKPEYGVSAGNGMIYANIADKSEVAEVDTKQMKVVRRWSLAPCEQPAGLAIDKVHHRLFSGCRNKLMAVSDIAGGKVLQTLPIGAGTDANAYDPATGYAFASNRDGTLTVAHEDAPGHFNVVQTVSTMPGAGTMALDAKTHKIYLVSAQMGPVPATATPDNPRRRAPVLPNTFTLLVVGK